MVDIKYLKKLGISSGDYKKIFTAEPADRPQRVRRLVNLLRSRTDDGYRMCLNNWRQYAAIDLACETSFQQTAPTLVQHILSKNLDGNATLEAVRQWGLNENELFIDQQLEDGRTVPVLNRPLFHKVLIPLVMAYVMARLARLFNGRVKDFLKFKPTRETAVQRIFCEIWSGIIENTSRDLGYPATFRQAILQMLMYGVMLMFPQEQWYCESQMIDEGDGPQLKTIKEGIRYNLPHPSKFFYDINHPLTAINTDSGPEFAAHWDVKRFGDIMDDRKYWNRSKIYCGNNWMMFPGAGSFFKEFYPCTLQFPMPDFGGHDRTTKGAYYTGRTDRDKAVFFTQHFMKLIPRDWGLGRYDGVGKKKRLTSTYSYPVWHRFTMAGPDAIVYAEPYAYNPVLFMGYDYNYNAAKNDSLALQLMPWQTELGNFLTNILYASYKNLQNLTFYNNQVVDPKQIAQLQNSGFKQYAGGNYVGFDPLAFGVGRNDPDKVFHNVPFTQTDINQLLSMVSLWLNLLDRVQQFSAQESGAAASHQQSVPEVQGTQAATSQRVELTGGYVDEFSDALKLQQVHAHLAYKDPDFKVHVSANIPDVKRHLIELGFKIDDQDEEKISISGHKRLLDMEQFAASNEGQEPDRSEKVAQSMFQAVTMLCQQPALFEQVGAQNVIKIIETATIIGGGPPDFRIPIKEGKPGQGVPQNIIAAIQQAQQATIKAIEQSQIAPAAQHIQQIEQQVQALQQALQQLAPIAKAAQAAQDKNAIKQQEAKAKEQLDQAKFQAEEQRKQQAHQSQLERERQETVAKIELEAAAAKADIATKTAETVLAAGQDLHHAEEQHRQERRHAETQAAHDIALKKAQGEADIAMAEKKSKVAPKKAKPE